VVVLEETTGFGSLGSQIKEIAWNLKANCDIYSIHLQDKFIKCYGTKEQLMAAHDVHVERVKAALSGRGERK
jgi:transketolase